MSYVVQDNGSKTEAFHSPRIKFDIRGTGLNGFSTFLDQWRITGTTYNKQIILSCIWLPLDIDQQRNFAYNSRFLYENTQQLYCLHNQRTENVANARYNVG